MFTFLTGLLGGAAFGGVYVLLTTPRSGKENRRVIKHYVQDVKVDVENVQNKAENMQGAMANLNAEVDRLQAHIVPEAQAIKEDFSSQASIYTRRINEGVKEIQDEVDDLNARIERIKSE